MPLESSLPSVLLLLGAGALLLSISAEAQESQQRQGSHHPGQSFLDLQALCEEASDREECLRRVAVCRRVHRTTARRPDLHHPSVVSCAHQLNITLPEVPEGGDARMAYRRWARSHPTQRTAIFNCIHGGTTNSDGTVNRTLLEEGVRNMLAGEQEPELLQELLDRVETCPIDTSRLEVYRCVLRGCATS